MKKELELFSPVQVENTATCRTCENREPWECGTKVIQYCKVRSSNRTENKLLKIKCKQPACIAYKEYNGK